VVHALLSPPFDGHGSRVRFAHAPLPACGGTPPRRPAAEGGETVRPRRPCLPAAGLPPDGLRPRGERLCDHAAHACLRPRGERLCDHAAHACLRRDSLQTGCGRGGRGCAITPPMPACGGTPSRRAAAEGGEAVRPRRPCLPAAGLPGARRRAPSHRSPDEGLHILRWGVRSDLASRGDHESRVATAGGDRRPHRLLDLGRSPER